MFKFYLKLFQQKGYSKIIIQYIVYICSRCHKRTIFTIVLHKEGEYVQKALTIFYLLIIIATLISFSNDYDNILSCFFHGTILLVAKNHYKSIINVLSLILILGTSHFTYNCKLLNALQNQCISCYRCIRIMNSLKCLGVTLRIDGSYCF